MDAKINALNVEIGAFLYELRRFVADGKKIFVGNETIKLLADTVDIIQDQLLTKAEVIDLPNEINMKFLQELDSDYKLYRTIMCRLCKTLMPVTREAVHGHMDDDYHMDHLLQMPTPIADSLFSPAANGSNKQISFLSLLDDEIDVLRKNTLNQRASSDELFVEASKKSNSVQPKKIESYENENFVGASFAKLQDVSKSEDFSWEAPSHGFNFDSKYLIMVRNLPWKSTRLHIVEFFENIPFLNGMEGIQFVMNDKITETVEAFIQLESMKDYTGALKMHGKMMDGQYIDVFPVTDKSQFNHLVKMHRIPSKERVVFVKNIPKNYSEQDIRTFFDGLQIQSIRLTRGGTSAYVKFTTIDDVEFAIERNNGQSEIRIYRSTAQQMRNGEKERNGQLASSLSLAPLNGSMRRDWTKHGMKTDAAHAFTGYLKVRELPMTVNESYVRDLFIGLQLGSVQMERNEIGQFKGSAIVSFEDVQDYEMAIQLYLSPSQSVAHVIPATESEYMLAKEQNENLQ